MTSSSVGSEEWLSACPVPKYHVTDPRLHQRLKDERPVVIQGSNFADAAVKKWTLSYWARHAPADNTFTVYESKSKYFQFSDASKNIGRYVFESSITSKQLPFPEFLATYRARFGADAELIGTDIDECEGSGTESRSEGTSGTASDEPPCGTYCYLQQGLYEGLGPSIVEDFGSFKWSLCHEIAKRYGWGPLTTNVLFIGQQGVVTPPHYDEQQNLFVQLRGRKVFYLLHPKYFRCMYPYPYGHPADRQSQILDVHNPDVRKFPRFVEAEFERVVLEPGEMLYLPSYYWHQVESPWEATMSLSCWFKCGNGLAPSLPLRDPSRLVSLGRNMEKILYSTFGVYAVTSALTRIMRNEELTSSDVAVEQGMLALLGEVLAPEDRRPFLQELVAGRYGLPQLPPPDTGDILVPFQSPQPQRGGVVEDGDDTDEDDGIGVTVPASVRDFVVSAGNVPTKS